MKVAVIGGGGREHAIVNQLKKSKYVTQLFAIPGNAGIAEVAQTIAIGATEVDKIVACALENKFDLVFIAPDDPLALGLKDKLSEAGISAFGPTKSAAEIEWSKAFSKSFMKRHNIPTAAYSVFNDAKEALKHVSAAKCPIVVKADGLAAGKGVVICNTHSEAEKAVTDMMCNHAFSSAGDSVVIEEFLEGSELTVLAFTDGKSFRCMPSSQDHKRAYDNDEGPNTGGMGVVSPASCWSDALKAEIEEKIIKPTIDGLRNEGRLFQGILYFGLMSTKDGVKVIEYNARGGDPETQTVLPLLETDLIEVITACNNGTLGDMKVEWQNCAAACVVVASGGYPMNVVKGFPITIGNLEGVSLIHCGTALKEGVLVTNGGRVFCVTATASSASAAKDKVYSQIGKIQFQDARFRADIGKGL